MREGGKTAQHCGAVALSFAGSAGLLTVSPVWAQEQASPPELSAPKRIAPEAQGAVGEAGSPDTESVPGALDRAAAWRLTVGIGTAWVNGDPGRTLFQSGTLDAQSLTLDWQPSAVGLRLGSDYLASDEQHGPVTSRYRSTELQLAGTYAAPMPWESAQLVFFAGGMRAWQYVSVSDGDVKLGNFAGSFGPALGIDFGASPFGALRIVIRLFASEAKVNFDRLAFDHYFVERGIEIGGSYAF